MAMASIAVRDLYVVPVAADAVGLTQEGDETKAGDLRHRPLQEVALYRRSDLEFSILQCKLLKTFQAGLHFVKPIG